jgi:hypothetical protein
VAVGQDDDEWVKHFGGRVEVFEIAKDGQLIGCELEYDDSEFRAVTWLKCKMAI